MAFEKMPPLYVPQKDFEEKNPKEKGSCSKSFVSWVLAALLIALIIALCVQFLYPVVERRKITDIDTVHEFEGTPVEVHLKSKNGQNDEMNPQWHLDFLINPTRLCDTLNPPDSEAYIRDPEIKLLVLVPSAIDHFTERRTIRRTWGSVSNQPHGPMRLGFVLGTTSNSTEEDLIMNESEIFGDIIQADFQDTYRNLTTKSVLMLKWVSKHCAHAQYFLKADDDTFVNIHVLTDILQKPPFTEQDKFIGGFIHRGAQPSRTPNEKYYVSENDYSEELYPPYASGAAYVTNGPTASKLFEASKQVKPFLPMEDIFITGLCADEIAATLLHEPSFKYVDPPNPLNWNHYSSLATAHSMTPDSMDILWDQMTKHIFDLFDLTDSMSSSMSSSYSSEWLDKSIFDLFNWSKESSFESDSSAANSIANKFNSPEVKKEAMNWQSNEVNTDSWKDKGASPRPNKTPSLFDALFRNPLMDTGSLENSLRSPESDSLDSMKWPPFPFFPFGLGKPNLNITYFVLKK